MQKPLCLLIENLLYQIEQLLEKLSDEEYRRPLKLLSGASIGQHTRHIIDFFLELNKGYELGSLNYNARNRDGLIETSRSFATHHLKTIASGLVKEDKQILMVVETGTGGRNKGMLNTSYLRELIFTLDHTVHHMAFIKTGVESVSDLLLPEYFGVAFSTIKFRQECVR